MSRGLGEVQIRIACPDDGPPGQHERIVRAVVDGTDYRHSLHPPSAGGSLFIEV